MKGGAEMILNNKKKYTAYNIEWYIYENNMYCFRVRSDGDGGKKYTAYNVEWYINNGDIYCFRVRSCHN